MKKLTRALIVLAITVGIGYILAIHELVDFLWFCVGAGVYFIYTLLKE